MNILIVGAGAVGRGLIAPLFAKDHRVRFYDINCHLALKLSRERRYPMTDGLSERWQWVSIQGAYYRPHEATSWIARSDLIFVCVRVENLEAVAALLAKVNLPKQVIVCENTPNATEILQSPLMKVAPTIAECIIPEPTRAMRRVNSLLTYHDPNGYLVVGRELTGCLPGVPGIVYADNFALAWDLKWYLHCAFHALVAYHGLDAGHTFIHDTIGDSGISKRVVSVMNKAVDALIAKYPVAEMHIRERLERERVALADFARPDLCARVGRNAKRKASPGERLDALLQLIGGKNVTIEKAIQIAEGMDA